MGMLMRIAWRNIWRQKRRTLITAAAMGSGVACCMAMIVWADGMYVDAFELMVSESIGHVQIHHPDYPTSKAIFDTIEDGDELVRRLDALPETTAVSGRALGFALLGTDDRGPDRPQKSAGAQIVGVVPEDEAALTQLADKVEEGRYLSSGPSKEILLGVDLAETMLAEPGDEIVAVTQAADGSMGNDLYTVAGIVRTGNLVQDRSGAFLHLDDARELLVLGPALHEIALLAEDKDAVAAMHDAALSELGETDLLVQSWQEINPMLVQWLGLQDLGNGILLMMVFAVAALGILNTMLMSVFERTKELGVIRALGLRPTQMVSLILLETLALVAVAGGIGLTAGLLLDWYLVVYGFDYGIFFGARDFSFAGINFPTLVYGDFRWMPIVQIMVGLLVTSLLVAIWPAIRAARLKPVVAMRQE